jgi:ABC-type multidrug transport system fused ATPase/permease subunit
MYGLEGTDMEPSDEEVERVAKLANAHSFIEVGRYAFKLVISRSVF